MLRVLFAGYLATNDSKKGLHGHRLRRTTFDEMKWRLGCRGRAEVLFQVLWALSATAFRANLLFFDNPAEIIVLQKIPERRREYKFDDGPNKCKVTFTSYYQVPSSIKSLK